MQITYTVRFSEAKIPHTGKVLNIQNLPYFWNKKTHVVFFVFHFEQKKFSLMNALVYFDIDLGIHWWFSNKYTINTSNKIANTTTRASSQDQLGTACLRHNHAMLKIKMSVKKKFFKKKWQKFYLRYLAKNIERIN